MNSPEVLLLPLLCIVCLAAGFTIQLVKNAGWRGAVGWLAAVVTGAYWSSVLITQLSVPWSNLFHVAATLLPLCVMMIPLLGMFLLAWLTGGKLAGGIILLTKRFTK